MNTAPSIPQQLSHRPVWNGYVIPFSTFVAKDGTPNFRITDQSAWIACVNKRLCGICGQPMVGDVFFIAGEKSIQSGLFFDPPMHEVCARYSFAVCPFLSGKKGYAPSEPKFDGVTVHIDENMSLERPSKFGLLQCSGYQVARVNDGLYFYTKNTEVSVEWLNTPAPEKGRAIKANIAATLKGGRP